MRILVSACLLGENCKYSGGNNYNAGLAELLKGHEAIPVCPEVMGGLSIPRAPGEIRDGRVINADGTSVDAQYRKGAGIALKIASERGAELAVLQSRSPSCGVNQIYDGSFSGKKIPGQGVFARLLLDNGFSVLDCEDLNPAVKLLLGCTDLKYRDFQAKLTPTVQKSVMLGVRMPDQRRLAKQFFKDPECRKFMENLPHKFYDENMLHAILLGEIKDFDECIRETERLLPFVDNWAVCDVLSPKIFRKHKPELLEKIREWTRSGHVYTCRFGIEMLMTHFLDGDFKPEYLEIPADISTDEYYLNMMRAWFFATALAKQWDSTIPYLEQHRLDSVTHKMTVRKCRESFRITPEQKKYIKSL